MPRIRPAATIVVASLLGLVALTGYQSHAIHNLQQQLEPAIVASVDLEEVFNNVRQWSEAEDQVLEVKNAFDERTAAMRTEIEDLQDEIDLLEVGSEARQEIEADLLRKALTLRGYQEFFAQTLDEERGEAIRRTYQEIREAARILADQQQWDLVIVNDSLTELPPAGERDMLRNISARRILHAGRTIDVTDQLIAYLNAN